jgi:type I restriction enzyme, S subunit
MMPKPALLHPGHPETTELALRGTLPVNWTWTTLGEVAAFINGDRGANYPKPTDYLESGVAFVNTGHINARGRLDLKRMQYISRASFERLRAGRLREGDIVYCLRGSTIGKTARVNLAEGAIASSLVIIRSKPDVSQDFLYFFLTSPFAQQFVKQHDNGSAQPNLSVAAISKYPVPLPPPSEQQAIASVLRALDDKIELNRRMNETLEALAQSLFKSWFVDATQSGLPKGWRESTVGAELTTLLGGTPSRSNPTFWEGGTIPWINSGKANEFRVVEPSEFITKAGFENSSTKLLPERTTIIAITGATLGQVSLLEIEACANQSVVGVLGSQQLPNEFVYLWVKENIDTLISWQTGGAQQHINKDNVNALKIVCPPEDVIRAYTDVVRPMFDLIKSNCFESRTLAALRDAMLPMLLSGELRVPVELQRRWEEIIL